ncbi:MAG: PcfB family protein [Oliverpabstia sp.]
MQEEVENRTINLAISTTRLTSRSIVAGIRKYLQHREKVKARKGIRDTAVHGKQSVKQLLGQNQGATNVEIDKDGIRDFERLAKKYGVDFAVRKDKSVDPPRYLVFVRSKDADALDAICKEHQARSLTKDKKPSVLAQLKKFKEMVAAIPRKVREKKQERDL